MVVMIKSLTSKIAYYFLMFKHCILRDLRFSRLWRFKSRSSGLWRRVVW